MKFARKEKKQSPLQLTPIIDIVFLLLIFFMIGTRFHDVTLIDLAVEVKSQSENQEYDNMVINMNKEQIEINLIDNKNVEIQGSVFQIDKLNSIIKQVMLFDNKKKVIIKILPEHNVQNLVHVIDQINNAGADNISILKKEEG